MSRPPFPPCTVTLETIDHGPVTFDCPPWCIGHGWQVGAGIGRNDVTHASVRVKAAAETEAHGLVPLLSSRISWAPFSELFPLVDVELYVQHSFPAEDIAHVAAGLRKAAERLELLAAEAIRLRGDVR
ncbi:hypothetical protein C1I97_01570 [Streptomyces sp. NTH33]|uniref:DUF6907 domain-containing protein n=1 Tax=Streptomyces sp. NTH33 TaxID=1735453 RepID=UPI000DA8A87C|nr:hypothetical protein [Streptomyces sp. NTH33]PZH20144.1 hypothetical protein C1I97_01570 [Streptomyces sp. NTH33]